jgi:radical SAM protein with 4Fe4S-binding SPASM domain
MISISYSELSRTIHQHNAGRRVLLEAAIEVTHRCPLQCVQCYNNLAMGDQAARQQELSLAEHCRLLDELADLGCLWVLFTGGEIFARPDFLEIYAYAKKKGFLITLFTNAILIDERVADYLAEWPPFSIEVTVYGRTQATYESVTKIPGSYERCFRGIELLRERRLPLKLKTVGVTHNADEVFALRQFAEDDLQVEFKFDALLNPRMDGSHGPLVARLSPEQVVGLEMRTPKVAAEYRALARDCGQEAPMELDDTLYTCGGGINSCAIDPYGRIGICVLAQQETYDLRKTSLKDGWENFLRQARAKKRTRTTRCFACRLQSLCSMCPAWGILENGDAESPVEFLCEVAHLRAMALGVDVPEHGPCEYCAGGAQNGRLKQAAENIAAWSPLAIGCMPVAESPFTVIGEGGRMGRKCQC